jgi:hypothetical protein
MFIPGNEAERIYYSIFNKKIPASITAQFEILSRRIESRFSEEEVNTYVKCIENVYDLEALEIAARYLKKMHLLSEKFRIMVYLAETLPENYTVFVNEHQNVFFGSILLISSMVRTVFKALKGIAIIKVRRI